MEGREKAWERSGFEITLCMRRQVHSVITRINRINLSSHMLGWRLLGTRVRRGGGFMQCYLVFGSGWIRGAWYRRCTHSSLFIERRRRIFTRLMHAHLLNRNNAFLMEIPSIEPRTCVRWILAFFNLFAMYKHLNLLRFEIRQNDSSRQPLKAVNTLTSTSPTWKGCWRYWRKH